MDNLNTHRPESLYEAFAPAEARRVADKPEIHHTPRHGSWLNMAEVELSVLGRAVAERVGDKAALAAVVAGVVAERNAAGKTVDWRFTTADARVKLAHLYPSIKCVEPLAPNCPRPAMTAVTGAAGPGGRPRPTRRA